jgi:hypothetical protein
MVRAKKAFIIVAAVVGPIALLYWGAAFALADWLRFSSPTSPDVMTGQVIYMKAVKGVFYVTPGQHFWLETALLPVWLVGAISIVTFNSLRSASMTWSPLTITLGRLFGGIVWLSWLVLFGFGDQVIALVTTGSFALPPEPTAHIGPSIYDWLGPLATIVMIGFVGASALRGWWSKHHGKASRGATPLVL